MRKLTAILIFCLCLSYGVDSARAVNLEITSAGMEVTGTNTMTLHNCQVGSNFYYISFQWHPFLNTWIPTGFGPEYPVFRVQDYFPLEVGNTWTYQLSGGGTRTDTIMGTDEICGKVFLRMESSLGGANWWQNDGAGVWQAKAENPDGSYLVFCPPIQFSAPYVYSGFSKMSPYENVPLMNSDGIQIANIDGYISYTGNRQETVVTPAGTFPDCTRTNLAVSGTETWGGMASVSIYETWYGEGVGVVKSIRSQIDTIGGTIVNSSMSVEILQSATVGGITYP